MKFLWNYLKRHRWMLIGTLALATINQVFSLLDPQIFRIIIDKYASQFSTLSKTEFFRGIIVLLLASITVALISRIAKNFQDYYVNVIVQRLGTSMYADSVGKSFRLPYSSFEDQRSGELLSKLQKARTDSQALITGLINSVFLALIGILFVLSYAYFVHWIVGSVYLLMIPLLGFITFFISKKIKDAQAKVVKETASLAGSTTETLRNVELVKSLGLEKQEIDRLNAVNETILQLELKKIVLMRKLGFIQGTIINALRSGLLLLMLWLIFSHAITLGQFFSLYIYSFFIFTPLSELGTVAAQYQEARASIALLEEILSLPQERIPENAKTISHVSSIEFKNIDFHYASSERKALNNISVQIRHGETVAFVGPSGSGKTTVIKLIAGLYQPTKGSVVVNGMNLIDCDVTTLRQRIGLVAQETQLFAGSIRENLLFVQPQATDDECIEVLRQAAALTIIERGGKGLETKIGEGGIKLSGGERQRLAIARALLRNPDVLIFDEATSSLDSITEQSITSTIRELDSLTDQRITILVAHRLSTVAHADRIYVLEKGVIVEQGTFTELTSQHGLFSALWRQQLASDVAA